MATEVLIPWRDRGCHWRQQALDYVTHRWWNVYDAITVAQDDWFPPWGFDPADPDPHPWVKAHAVTPHARASTADVLVVADADVWVPGIGIKLAVQAVEKGAPWAIPHGLVHRLDQHATFRLLGDLGTLIDGPWEERPYLGRVGGGVVVLPRQTYLDIPLDPRFEGWGHEDDAWAAALTMLAGKPWRGEANLYHLWHPAQPRDSRLIGSERSLDLLRRYRRANKRTMEHLMVEARARV